MQAYCVKYRATREIRNARPMTMKNGRQGIYPFCAVTSKPQSASRKPFLAIMVGITLLLTFAFSCTPGSSSAYLATLNTPDFHSLAFHPQNPNIVFFGHHGGVLKSVDGGRTWQETGFRGRNMDAMGMAISSAEPQRMYVTGHDIFFGSSDGGKSWTPVRHDLPGTDIHGFAMDSDDPVKLYAFVVGYGFYVSNNAAINWQFISARLPGDVMALASSGGQTLYAGSMDRGVLKSTDGGKTWVLATNGIEGRTAMTLAVDPKQRQTIYAGTERGLFKSSDAGNSWSRLPFPGANAVVVAIAPGNSQVVMAIEVGNDRKGYVYRSEDGGQTW